MIRAIRSAIILTATATLLVMAVEYLGALSPPPAPDYGPKPLVPLQAR